MAKGTKNIKKTYNNSNVKKYTAKYYEISRGQFTFNKKKGFVEAQYEFKI